MDNTKRSLQWWKINYKLFVFMLTIHGFIAKKIFLLVQFINHSTIQVWPIYQKSLCSISKAREISVEIISWFKLKSVNHYTKDKSWYTVEYRDDLLNIIITRAFFSAINYWQNVPSFYPKRIKLVLWQNKQKCRRLGLLLVNCNSLSLNSYTFF